VIDNPLQADLLMAKLKAALPLPARAAPLMLAQLHEQAPDLDLSPQCQITGIHYAGDEGGIVCKLDFGTEDTDPVFSVSITYLTFDRRLGSRHTTGEIARLAARTGNMVRLHRSGWGWLTCHGAA
jgi:hypothetical protein